MADVTTRDPRAYELMAIFVPELSDEELVEQIERVTGYITDQNGTITEVLRDSPWGRRRLAYTVRFNSVDYRDGIYVVYHFDSVPSVVTEIERELKLDVRVMRYLLVHDDPLAGEKDTGQGLDGESVEGEAEAASSEPVAAEEVAQSSTETAEEAAPAEAAAPVEEAAPAQVAEVAAETAPEGEAAEPEAVAEAEEVPAEPEAPVVEEEPADAEVVADAPEQDESSSEEETKED